MLSRAQRQRSLVGVIAAMALVNLVYGITFPLLALVLDGQGISKTMIGLNTIVQAAATLVVSPLAPGLLLRFNPARLMQWSALVMAGLFILAGWFPNVWFWFPLRFIIGALTTMLWVSSESVINELVDEHWRGRVIGIYSSAGAAGFALGPLLLIFTGSEGLLPFIATSVMTLLVAIPLFWVKTSTATHEPEAGTGLWKVIRLAPAIMLANIVYASAVESISTFFPLFALQLGVAEQTALSLMTVIGLGGMVLILPLSWLADRVNRLSMLLACVLLTMVMLLLMPALVRIPVISGIFAFAFGGISGMIYALGLVLIGVRFRGRLLAIATTAYTACWGTGAIIGPMLVGAGMDWLGGEHMAMIIFMIYLAYLPWPVSLIIRGRHRNEITQYGANNGNEGI